MAVPKRKVSRSRRDSRQANKFLRPAAFGLCKECATPLQPHQACSTCGFYKGRKVLKTKMDRALGRKEAQLKTEAAAPKTAQENNVQE
ncbi:MAG: 50S ribosomal protein L32 [candidate division TM6 bacterium GW2011_GWE2_41_16]|nr:MAG: 50S ribosomal protein L32 [candidate division TM6 bacterium GW2011_GWE2_41_16]